MNSQLRSNKISKKKRLSATKVPPGQRLLKYIGLAIAIILIPGWATFNGQNQKQILEKSSVINIAAPFYLSDEQTDIETQLKDLAVDKPLRLGVFAIDPSLGRYVNIDGQQQFAAASIIKLPILVSALRAIDSNKIEANKMLTIKSELVTGGSGYLQWQPIGTKVPFIEVLRLMIVFSDNTATNMVIEALGGKEPLNKDFKDWGLKQTVINNYLGDFTGTNKTSPYDLVYLLGRVDRGEFLTTASRTWMLNTMKKARVRTLVWPGLGPGAQFAHKTGDIGSMVGDTGIVTTSDGKKYYIAVQVERPHNDLRANALIRDASKLLYGRLVGYAEMSSVKETKEVKKSHARHTILKRKR